MIVSNTCACDWYIQLYVFSSSSFTARFISGVMYNYRTDAVRANNKRQEVKFNVAFKNRGCQVTNSLLSINFNEGRLDIKPSACCIRNCVLPTVGVGAKGFGSSSTATPREACGKGGGGVIEWDVEWEVDSTEVRLACAASTREARKNMTCYIKDPTEDVDMRRTLTTLPSAGTTT
jgi:hypothetical protein